jgi:hypothetical protein
MTSATDLDIHDESYEQATAGPRPDLNGQLLRVRNDGSAPVYQIVNGLRRLVPKDLFTNVYVKTLSIDPYPDLMTVSPGRDFSATAHLVRADSDAAVWLVDTDYKVKYAISSPDVMSEYSLDMSKVVSQHKWCVDAIPNGDPFQVPTNPPSPAGI